MFSLRLSQKLSNFDLKNAVFIEKILLPIILFLVLLTYLPITDNYFALDDFYHLAHAAQEGLSFSSFFKHVAWVHLQPVFRALIAIEFQLFGTDPQGYYWISILLHVANVYLAMRFFSEQVSRTFDLRIVWFISFILGGCHVDYLSVHVFSNFQLFYFRFVFSQIFTKSKTLSAIFFFHCPLNNAFILFYRN